MVAWRGTESFNGYDWSTDFDFSWYKLQGMGLVHIGFLEALGLVDRNSMESFTKLETNCAKVSKRSSHLSSPHLLKKKKELLASLAEKYSVGFLDANQILGFHDDTKQLQLEGALLFMSRSRSAR